MSKITITLSRLIELFGQSVNTPSLPEPVRALAARLMTLTAHVRQIGQKTSEHAEQIKTLTDIVTSLVEQRAASPAPAAAAATAAAPAPAVAAPVAEEKSEEEMEEEDFIAKARAEAAAEVAAVNGTQSVGA